MFTYVPSILHIRELAAFIHENRRMMVHEVVAKFTSHMTPARLYQDVRI
jgi:hypothetical protein